MSIILNKPRWVSEHRKIAKYKIYSESPKKVKFRPVQKVKIKN